MRQRRARLKRPRANARSSDSHSVGQLHFRTHRPRRKGSPDRAELGGPVAASEQQVIPCEHPPSLLSIWRSCRHHPVHPRPCETSPVSGTWWSTRSAGSRAGSGASGSWRSPRLAPASRLSPNGSRSRLREKDETAGGEDGVATTTTRARARAHCSRCRSWRRHRLAMRLGLEASRFRSEGVLWVQAARARRLTFSWSIPSLRNHPAARASQTLLGTLHSHHHHSAPLLRQAVEECTSSHRVEASATPSGDLVAGLRRCWRVPLILLWRCLHCRSTIISEMRQLRSLSVTLAYR